MPRGGARLGAGRPRKSEIRAEYPPQNREEAAVAYEFLTSAVRDPDLPFESRLRAAAILLPFERRKVPPLRPLGSKERAVEAALEAAVGVYATPDPPNLRVEEPDRDIYAVPPAPKGFRRQPN